MKKNRKYTLHVLSLCTIFTCASIELTAQPNWGKINANTFILGFNTGYNTITPVENDYSKQVFCLATPATTNKGIAVVMDGDGVVGSPVFHMLPTGELVIGKNNFLTNNGHALTVKGSVFTIEVLMNAQGWADYVFNPSYKLMPLQEVEAFIARNRHLPGTPSAAEIKKSGLDLAPIAKLQMQKIEELTLYIIKQRKKITELEKKINEIQ